MTRSQNPNVLLLLFLSSLLLHSSLQCTRPVVRTTTVAPAPAPAPTPAPSTAAPTTTTTPPSTTTACVPEPACDNLDTLALDASIAVALQGSVCPSIGSFARAICADPADVPTNGIDLGINPATTLTCTKVGWTAISVVGGIVQVDSIACD